MKKRKSFKSLAKDLEKIRRRPVSPQAIEEFNRIIEGEPSKTQSEPKPKSARSPEANS